MHRRLSQVRSDGTRKRGLTPLHPECNYIDVLEQHLERLHYGQPILKPVYEHATGTLVRPEYVRPRPFVVVDGLLGFSTPTLRQFYDVKVFLEPPENLRRVWKMSAIPADAAIRPKRCWRNWSGASPTRATSFARNASMPTSW